MHRKHLAAGSRVICSSLYRRRFIAGPRRAHSFRGSPFLPHTPRKTRRAGGLHRPLCAVSTAEPMIWCCPSAQPAAGASRIAAPDCTEFESSECLLLDGQHRLATGSWARRAGPRMRPTMIERGAALTGRSPVFFRARLVRRGWKKPPPRRPYTASASRSYMQPGSRAAASAIRSSRRLTTQPAGSCMRARERTGVRQVGPSRQRRPLIAYPSTAPRATENQLSDGDP